MIIVGAFMLVASIANLAGYGPMRGWLDRYPIVFRFAWGGLGVLGGAFFIAWPFVAAAGVVY